MVYFGFLIMFDVSNTVVLIMLYTKKKDFVTILQLLIILISICNMSVFGGEYFLLGNVT